MIFLIMHIFSQEQLNLPLIDKLCICVCVCFCVGLFLCVYECVFMFVAMRVFMIVCVGYKAYV